jgi:hypothetical protein
MVEGWPVMVRQAHHERAFSNPLRTGIFRLTMKRGAWFDKLTMNGYFKFIMNGHFQTHYERAFYRLATNG